VFLSSHLMSEMAITADRLVIIGRGRLITETTAAELLAGGPGNHVRVRTPESRELATLLRARGISVTAQPDGTLHITGADADVVGELAQGQRLPAAGTLETASDARAALHGTHRRGR
jgi:ABC-2 type transport system ATP-binding protein